MTDDNEKRVVDTQEYINGWKSQPIVPGSNVFNLTQKVMEKIQPQQKSITIQVINKERSRNLRTPIKDTYRFNFEWQSEDIHSIEVYKKELCVDETTKRI